MGLAVTPKKRQPAKLSERPELDPLPRDGKIDKIEVTTRTCTETAVRLPVGVAASIAAMKQGD